MVASDIPADDHSIKNGISRFDERPQVTSTSGLTGFDFLATAFLRFVPFAIAFSTALSTTLVVTPLCTAFLTAFSIAFSALPSPRVLTSEILGNGSGNEDRTFAAPPVLLALIVLAGSAVVRMLALAILAMSSVKR
jgi:hypothetical protein